MSRRNELLARAYFVVAVFSILALVIAFRVVRISIVEGDKWRAKAAQNVKWMEVDADRGNIYSDDESLLATSLQFFEIRLDATVADKKVYRKGVDSLALMLSKSVRSDKTASEWRKTLYKAREQKNRYLLIAKGLLKEDAELLRTFPIFREGRYGGGYLELRYGTRRKPFNQLASRTIGNDRENADKIGLESSFDRFLKGPTDKRLMKKIDNTQDIWVPVYDPSEFEVKKGDDIITTLSLDLQDIVHKELSKQVIKSNATAGTAILMEVKTGAIKAISNLQLQDSNSIVEMYNTAIAHRGEPGSTFKLATVLALMEDRLATPSTRVNLNAGSMKFADRIMHDSEKHGKYEVTMKEAFALSSNVGIAKLANDAYNKSTEGRSMFRNRLSQFGLDKITEIEIDGEPRPIIKKPVADKKTWYGTTIPWMAHGYELSMTPLQLLTFYNAVANNGKMMKPYLVSEIRNEDKIVKQFEPRVLIESIARPENITYAKEMMEEVVKNGTASAIKSPQLTMAGKTGTTRINYSNKEEYAKYNASFCGYFPAENPEYSLMIVIYEPKGAFYGASVAAPVFKAIAEQTMVRKIEINPVMKADSTMYASVSIPERNAGFGNDFIKIFDYVGLKYKKNSKNNWVSVDPLENKMIISNKKIAKTGVPDVRGMGARDAMYVLENVGLSVSIYGKGKVIKQSLTPGTKVNRQRIEVFLN